MRAFTTMILFKRCQLSALVALVPFFSALASAAASAMPACPPSTPNFEEDSPKGRAVAIGGALKYDNAAVWSKLVEYAGGKGAKFVVLPTASGSPESTGMAIVEALERQGAKAIVLPVSPRIKSPTVSDAVNSKELIAQINDATGVFFSGGDQSRIVEALFDAKGTKDNSRAHRPTPLLEAIWRLYRKGGVVAGTSAGAAIMSESMIRDVPVVFDALAGGVKGLRDGQELDRGLGFVGKRIFVDQHFLKRGRIGRLLPAMVAKEYTLGLGIEENTAAVFCGDSVEIVGARGALWVDLALAKQDAALVDFNLSNIKLTYLDHGDQVNTVSGKVTSPKAAKKTALIDPNAMGFKPYNQRAPFYPDILGDNTIVQAMSALLDSSAASATGLAMPDISKPQSTASLAFEFKLQKASDTYGYFSPGAGGEDYTVVNIRLDVRPVSLAQPLYSPKVGK